MNSSLETFDRNARFKAAASIAALLGVALLGMLLVAGLAPVDKKTTQPVAPGKAADQTTKNGLEPTETAPISDPEVSPVSISVQIVAPPRSLPPGGKPTPSPSPAAEAANESHSDHPPKPRVAPQIDLDENPAQATNAAPNPRSETQIATPTDHGSNTKTNAEMLVSIKGSYDFTAVQKCLQTGKGELVALSRRPGASNTLMVIDRSTLGTYQLRKTRASDNLANLGLRLQATDGDLPDLERRLCTQTGVETVTFFFAPAADFARAVEAAQKSALQAFQRSHPAATTRTVVLNGRFSCTPDGAPSYTITEISMSNETSAAAIGMSEPSVTR